MIPTLLNGRVCACTWTKNVRRGQHRAHCTDLALKRAELSTFYAARTCAAASLKGALEEPTTTLVRSMAAMWVSMKPDVEQGARMSEGMVLQSCAVVCGTAAPHDLVSTPSGLPLVPRGGHEMC